MNANVERTPEVRLILLERERQVLAKNVITWSQANAPDTVMALINTEAQRRVKMINEFPFLENLQVTFLEFTAPCGTLVITTMPDLHKMMMIIANGSNEPQLQMSDADPDSDDPSSNLD